MLSKKITFGQALRQLGMSWDTNPRTVADALEKNFSSVIGKKSTAKYSNPNATAVLYMLMWYQDSAQGYTPEEMQRANACPIDELAEGYFNNLGL